MKEFLPLLLFSFASTITPGPNNFMIMNSGLNFGIKKSLPHYLGISLGFPIMVLIIALGFGAVFLTYSWIKELLKYIGAIYMLYLSWQIASSTSKVSGKKISKPMSFIQALLFQWVNPKAWLMAVGAISIFSVSADYFQNALAISATFLLISLPCTAVWLGGGAALKRFLKEEKHQRWFNIAMALCLAVSIITIFVE